MKQRMLCLFLALALAVGLTPAARAAGLENFSPVQSYTGQFADVPRDAWFYDSVGDAYAYGLMNGRSADRDHRGGHHPRRPAPQALL